MLKKHLVVIPQRPYTQKEAKERTYRIWKWRINYLHDVVPKIIPF